MKSLSLLLLVATAIFAMEENLQLDQTALQEFLSYGKQMVTLSEGKVNANNALFKRYIELSKLNEITAAQEFARPALQEKAKTFYAWISSQPVFQNGLAQAQATNTTEVWDAFRNGNKPLFAEHFKLHGISTPETKTCEAFFNVNPHLSPEQIEKTVAQSFMVYYIRQMQRQHTEVKPSAIPIK